MLQLILKRRAGRLGERNGIVGSDLDLVCPAIAFSVVINTVLHVALDALNAGAFLRFFILFRHD